MCVILYIYMNINVYIKIKYRYDKLLTRVDNFSPILLTLILTLRSFDMLRFNQNRYYGDHDKNIKPTELMHDKKVLHHDHHQTSTISQ